MTCCLFLTCALLTLLRTNASPVGNGHELVQEASKISSSLVDRDAVVPETFVSASSSASSDCTAAGDSDTCMSWCPNNSNDWDTKCTWTKCSTCCDCTESTSIVAGTMPLTSSLDNGLFETGCYKPVSEGSWGWCGASSCKNSYVTCEQTEKLGEFSPIGSGGPATVDGETGTYITMGKTTYAADTCEQYTTRTTTADATDWNPTGTCDSTCTQQTTGVCSSTFLKSVIRGTGVKYAYCNDKWLVMSATGEPSVMTPNLNDAPYPPGSNGDTERSGMPILDLTRKDVLYFPLTTTLLDTDDLSNNLHLFESATYLTGVREYFTQNSTTENVPLPNNNGVGMGVNGQSIFPMYNDNGVTNPGQCQVDSCNTHIGQGGGQPHWHGDPFGDDDSSTERATTCLYGPTQYHNNDTASHPPVIGFAFDGHLIYGRYLSNQAPGFAAPLLDQCGGHKHADQDYDEHGIDLQATYHYHTQVMDAECEERDNCDLGENYKTSTTGPLNCYRADLSAQEGSSALLGITSSGTAENEMAYRCCGMTDYYLLEGWAAFPDSASAASDSCCSVSQTGVFVQQNVSDTTSDTTEEATSDQDGGYDPCASGTGDNGSACPPDTENGACPPGCEYDTHD